MKGDKESPDMGEEGSDEEESYDSSVAVDAAQALLDAQKSGSASEYAKAFKKMLAVCME
jgi:hypothetical protein